MSSILPTTNNTFGPSSSSASYYNQSGRSRKGSPALLRRLFRFPQMDFEFAVWQMGYLLIAPRRVYRNIYYHKQTKNRWSRDDPAFIVILAAFLTLSGIVWGFTYHLGTYGIIKTILSMLCIDFLLFGAMISTFTWYISNKFLIQNANTYAVAQQVEWAYAFDVHCNAFIPVYLILYVIQLFFLPLILKENWISMFIGNFMYCVALIWYMVGVFLGFNGKDVPAASWVSKLTLKHIVALPFLVHTELFLYPIALWIALFVASLFGFNIPQYVLSHYF
ncbi:UNC-50-like protein [Mucor ambiguus]|uniref:UNC-50-like protein n=1 Tax=Mucor ambiguus TaxID=91626 RepID=A0A0C9MBB1_9FUNG|nr:UNC-50-like protein [Mucor ambiguus]